VSCPRLPGAAGKLTAAVCLTPTPVARVRVRDADQVAESLIHGIAIGKHGCDIGLNEHEVRARYRSVVILRLSAPSQLGEVVLRPQIIGVSLGRHLSPFASPCGR
jgi:hypothetical protein